MNSIVSMALPSSLVAKMIVVTFCMVLKVPLTTPVVASISIPSGKEVAAYVGAGFPVALKSK